MAAPDRNKQKQEMELLAHELGENPQQRFNVAFALMAVIPLLIIFYILVTELFDINILVGKIGVILTMTIGITIVGYYVAYLSIRKVLRKVMHYAAVAKHSDEMKSTLIATVSHDLKNPIAILKTSVYNLMKGLLGKVSDEQEKVLELCYVILQRMTRLTVGLLDIYKIEAGMVKPDLKECDVASLVEGQLSELGKAFEEKNIKLVRKMPGKPVKAALDADKIAEVINNLVGNALKFTPSGGTITVKLTSAEGYVRFECLDTGPGVPADKLQKIFDKFERLDRAKEGAGLGLAISKDLVELHNGKIWAESFSSGGSSFIFAVPDGAKEKGKR